MDYGFLTILPPILAITFAILTKDVLLSLFIGVSVGGLILVDYNPLAALISVFEIIFDVLGDGEWNVRVIMVCVLLGAFSGLLQVSGGAFAFADWLAQRIKGRVGAQAVTWVMGLIVFFDDYFNSLTIGTVMRPVTDKFKISREKLAYILDSTAAPVCIIAPVSSWVAYVSSLVAAAFVTAGVTDQPFAVFLKTIPYNFYALGAIFMVPLIIFSKREYGPMAKAERRAVEEGLPFNTESDGSVQDDFKDLECSKKGTVSDMIVPVLVLFFGSFGFILYTGGFFDGGVSFAEAFNESDIVSSLIYGIFLSLLVAIIMYQIKGTVKVLVSTQAMVIGMKTMFYAFVILTLAWSIGTICDELGTGEYLANLAGGVIPGSLTPFLIFILACFIAFSTGASWGTYAIMIPIAVPLAIATDANMVISIAAVLSGGVFGDHCSPLADTTILSSVGAGVNHMDHVTTQLPYAVTVGLSAAVGFLLAGFMNNPLIPLAVTIGLVLLATLVLSSMQEKRDRHNKPPVDPQAAS